MLTILWLRVDGVFFEVWVSIMIVLNALKYEDQRVKNCILRLQVLKIWM